MSNPEERDEQTQNGYDRPVLDWSCGHADGAECLLGPTGLGICQASGACTPRQDGDRWICNRPAIRGGVCEDGPTPEGACCHSMAACSPRRTVRSRRNAFAFACLALTLGGLLVAFNTNYRREFIAPGQLTTQHAQLLTASEVENRCASCHPEGNDSMASWVASTMGLKSSTKDPHTSTTQTELCMKCHDKSISSSTAKFAHNLPLESLAALTKGKQTPISKEKAFQLVGFAGPANESGELACSTCHREHHGSDHELTKLTNTQCQNCHAEQFDSFEHGHPEFEKWPYDRRQRIIFDHATHSGKHFKKENREFNCNDCHKNDGTTDIVSVAGYESCAECHDKGINVSLNEGVAVFKLPTLDTLALEDAGFDIGQWPSKADGEFDGVLPETMKLLLSADEGALEAFDELGSDFDFYDADPDDETQMEAVAQLVWAIKRLLNDFAKDPAATWQARMKNAVNRDISEVGLHHLQTSHSRHHFATCRDQWFTDLNEDLRLEFDGQTSLASINDEARDFSPSYGDTIASTAPQDIDLDRKVGWSVGVDEFRIDYFPEGHGDAFLSTLLDVLADTAGEATEDPIEDARAAFLGNASVGTCITCHSVDDVGATQLVNWHGGSSDSKKEFTRFSHRQHLIQPNLADCSHCHQLNQTSEYAATYKAGGDFQTVFASSFHPIGKASCIECHNQQSSKDACTTCHNYHVHPIVPEQHIPLVAESVEDAKRR